ncbi:MAG: sigma-70 family RNA polymerase sigma factor [Polyangiaceae bacterium]|nr:sigma-70 family RNA polymerase sigma factor [Polyangiaceae bacterium]
MRSDPELLERWRGGDAPAGQELVQRHWASIASFFRSKVGDDGADLISQTFLACVEGRDRIDDVQAYLFAVARRRLADHFRKRARMPTVDLSVSSLTDLGAGPATELGRREQAELLRRALATIPLDDQIALELSYFEGLSGAAIAQVLEVGENTVRSRLARAREKLRLALAELAPADEAARAEAGLERKP